MIGKEEMERAWNAALDHADNEPEHSEDNIFRFTHLRAPSTAFEEWYQREVVHPPEHDEVRELRGI